MHNLQEYGKYEELPLEYGVLAAFSSENELKPINFEKCEVG